MSLVVITGGARSGKSSAAEKLALGRQELGMHVAVAVFGHSVRNNDTEFAERIAKHQARRPDGFETLEPPPDTAWIEQAPQDSLLVVDCLGTLLGRLMEDAWQTIASQVTLNGADADTLPPGLAVACESRLDDVVQALAARKGDTIVVTNEVGDGIVPAFATGRLFRDLLGRANHALVGHADAAYLAVAGRLIDLSELPLEATWPED
jgi:adenosyl cobinamide kinase/adenosyl cobinamide phosphate guanylyltransferase